MRCQSSTCLGCTAHTVCQQGNLQLQGAVRAHTRRGLDNRSRRSRAAHRAGGRRDLDNCSRGGSLLHRRGGHTQHQVRLQKVLCGMQRKQQAKQQQKGVK